MSKILKPEDLTKIAIDPKELTYGQMVAISSNINDDKIYCIVWLATNDVIIFYKHVKDQRVFMKVTADDLIEYDMKIEVL